MKIAIPYENGQVFQHFGHSAQFKLYTAEEGRITGAEVVSTDGQGHGALVGFLPQSQNLLANAIVSFSCAMQVQAFRKVNGYAFASTMCIGDLRSGVEAFCIWRKSHEPHAKDRMVRYFGIIFLFALGAGLGSKSAAQLGGRAIWLSCCFLLVSFTLMFIREELEENPVIEKDLTAIRQETREIDRTLKQELQEEQRELTQSARK